MLNLDVKQWAKEDLILSDIIDEIGTVMKEAKTLKNAAKLSELTHLKPVLCN